MISSNPHHFINNDLFNQQVFMEHLLRADTVLGSKVITMNTLDPNSCPSGAYILEGMKEIITESISMI